MKEAIGGSWLFTLIIALLAFFTCFVSISTNYTRTYNVKDEIVSILSSRGGATPLAIKEINGRLKEIGYSATGACPENGCWYKFSKNNDSGLSTYAEGVNYCISKTLVGTGAVGHPDQYYYSVAVFFQVDMPVVGQIFKMTLVGETPIVNVGGGDTYFINASCGA